MFIINPKMIPLLLIIPPQPTNQFPPRELSSVAPELILRVLPDPMNPEPPLLLVNRPPELLFIVPLFAITIIPPDKL